MRDWPAGPWLGELKHRWLTGDTEATVVVPDGSAIAVQELARELLLEQPGRRLVYATDLEDTADNRKQLTGLARGAHTLVCEAPFLAGESQHAARNGHLTARACGEIATAAAVGQLVPFHFSRRHADEPEKIYEEIRAACPQMVQPPLGD